MWSASCHRKIGVGRRAALWMALGMAISPPAARAETQLAAYLGNSWTARSDVELAGRTFPRVTWETRSFQSPPYYGVRAAHFFAEETGWGIALDFFHDKAYAANGSIAPALRRLSFSPGLNHVTLDVNWRTRAGPLRPYAGLGAGSLVPHVEAQSDSASVDEYQWFRGVSAKAQVGAQWRLPGPAGVFLEYRFTLAHLRVSVPGGDLSTWPRTHHFVGGVFVAL
jgi:lipid A oxidase